MKTFLIRIGFCLCIVLLFDVAYVFLVGGNLRTYAKKYFALPGDVEVLVLGDSHADRAWFSNTDKKVYNFANGSDNISDMKQKFRYAAEHSQGGTKKIVVLPFDAHLISPYREVKQNNRINTVLNHAYLNKHVVNALPLIFDPDTEFDLKRFFLSLYKKQTDANRYFSRAHATARFQDQFPDSLKSRKLLAEYQELIESIRGKGYQIIAVKYPVHPFYDSLVQADPRSRSLNHAMDSLAQANHLTVSDFSQRIKAPELFLDQDHVNKEGSLIFVTEFKKAFAP